MRAILLMQLCCDRGPEVPDSGHNTTTCYEYSNAITHKEEKQCLLSVREVCDLSSSKEPTHKFENGNDQYDFDPFRWG